MKRGLVRPNDKLEKILEIRRACTFRTLFFGVGDCLFLGFLLAACLWLLFIQAGSQVPVCMIVAVSPFAYMASYVLTAWKDYRLQLFDMRMTCRYTIRQISAFRMVYFSGMNILLNGFVLLRFRRFWIPGAMLWKVLGLSFVSVFVYGAMLLLFQIRGKPCLTMIAPPFLWGTLHTAIIAFCGEKLERFLLDIAGSLVLFFGSVAFSAYLTALSVLLTSKYKGEDSGVISEPCNEKI